MSVVQLHPVTLGGSTAAAAAGIDPYRSRVMLWCELTGRVEREETEAMRWGTALEGVIAHELTERGYFTSRWSGPVTDPERPWLIGHPGGVVELEGEGGPEGLLEIKTASVFAARWDESPPLHYEAQCQVYMHLTGLHRALLACLVGGQRLVLQEVERDEKAIALLLAAMEELLGYVERDEPPPPDGSDSATDALKAMYPQATEGRAHRLTAQEYGWYQELRARREQESEVSAQKAELENLLKAAMGDAEVALSPHDAEVLRWSNVTTTRVDTKLLRETRPELSGLFTTTTESRRFTVA